VRVTREKERRPRQVAIIERRYACGDEFGLETGEEVREDQRAAAQQPVRVPALRHAVSVADGPWQLIALHQGDRPIRVGKHPCGQQSRHAGPEDDGMGTGHGSFSRPANADRRTLSVAVGTMTR